ncbi:chromosome segregation protein [Cordyceps militaris CM01]|uniref:Chromosome segregation protein n=1 Tax=Cordyceps militaris (strain CM01) TaxID=983644 RepID=G3JCQ7_CORMM|nr:chromosome segregation protein [Cordyceps militaris CM01]EGX94665.1 chromosome segregation protein [Cordyceps militaris CM01]
MATRVRNAGRFATLVDSDSDSDLGGLEVYPRKRQSSVARASNRITKPASKLAGSIERKAPRRSSPGRRALMDKSNNINAPRPSHKSKDEKPVRPLSDELSDDDSMLQLHKPREIRKKQRLEESRPVKQSFAITKRYTSSSPRREARRNPVEFVAELEEDCVMDMVDVIEPKEEEEELPVPTSRQSTAPVSSHACPTSRSQNTQGENSLIELRLREMTKKYENLEGRYAELREVGVKTAERNYENLRKQADENASTANKLIAKLKEEVAAQRQIASDADSLRLQLQDSQSNVQELTNKAKELTSSLDEADRQIKALNAKLSASRAAPGTAIPSSAVKGNAAKSWTGQSEMVHAAHAKEDLYADLTGLIIQGVKQNGSEDIFDCIQTGRNGTLHFKLGIPGSSSTVSYEKSEVSYKPQLQSDRDADLIARLPSYLCAEIEFGRPQLANFYSKVVKVSRERQSESSE